MGWTVSLMTKKSLAKNWVSNHFVIFSNFVLYCYTVSKMNLIFFYYSFKMESISLTNLLNLPCFFCVCVTNVLGSGDRMKLGLWCKYLCTFENTSPWDKRPIAKDQCDTSGIYYVYQLYIYMYRKTWSVTVLLWWKILWHFIFLPILLAVIPCCGIAEVQKLT